MWPSSNMFFKKLITSLCFPRSTQSSNKPYCPPPAQPTSFITHLSRHFSQLNMFQTTSKQNIKAIRRTQQRRITSTMLHQTKISSSHHLPLPKKLLIIHLTPISHRLSHHNDSFSPPLAIPKSLINQSTSNDISRSSSGSCSGPLLQSAGGIPVPKYSPDPYLDFQMSMQEMLEARVRQSHLKDDPAEKWEYLHQLLTYYLSFNPVNTHEYIIMAFSDLLVNFLLHDEKDGGQKNGRRKCSVSRRLL